MFLFLLLVESLEAMLYQRKRFGRRLLLQRQAEPRG
jgi:hypothetical protein